MSQDWHFGKKLGEGANGAAFLAFRRDYLTEKPDPSETFVIKKVPLGKEPVTSKSAKLRETQLLAMIRHPYIVTYEDCFLEDGFLFVIMEFAGGGTMEKYCDAGTPPVPLELVYDSFVQCLLAVEYLHGHRIVHRDLKPANVFVLPDNSVKLGDLGEGWLRGDSADSGDVQERWASDPAQQGSIVGTPFYLAPECWRGDCADLDLADVWALGVLLYELCGKSRPFLGKSIHALALTVCKDPLRPPPGTGRGTLRGYPDDKLGAVVERMLDKDPAQRYTCQQLLAMPCLAEAVVRNRRPEDEWHAAEASRAVGGVRAAAPPPTFLYQFGGGAGPRCVGAISLILCLSVCLSVCRARARARARSLSLALSLCAHVYT